MYYESKFIISTSIKNALCLIMNDNVKPVKICSKSDKFVVYSQSKLQITLADPIHHGHLIAHRHRIFPYLTCKAMQFAMLLIHSAFYNQSANIFNSLLIVKPVM